MEYGQLVGKINLNTDEDFEFREVLEFINDAIDKVNIECGALFPRVDVEFDLEVDEYPAFNDSWQSMLLIPFACGRIKENDSSQFEYTDWYGQFDNNLELFKKSYEIPEEYLDPNARNGMYEADFSENVYNPLKGW